MDKEQSPRLNDHFSELKDPRIERNKLLRVPEIMATTISEILACLKEGQNGGIVAGCAEANSFRAPCSSSWQAFGLTGCGC
jgi:hypothetical protein